MYKEKKLIKTTLIYVIGSFSSKILSFLIVPIYTFYLKPEELGVYDLILTSINFFVPIISLQAFDGVFRWLLDKKVDNNVIISTGLKFMFCNIAITSGIFLILNNIKNSPYNYVTFLLLIFNCIYQYLINITRGLMHNKIYAIAGVINTVLLLLLNIVLIICSNKGIKGMMYSLFISNLCACCYLIISQPEIVKSLSVKHDKALLNKILKYSIPFVPNVLSWWIISASDRYIIGAFLGAQAIGIYAIANKFPMILNTILSLFNLAWQETAILEADNNDKDSFYSKIFQYFYHCLFSLTIFIIPLTNVILPLVTGSAYWSATRYIPLLYVGMLYGALSSFIGTGYSVSKKTTGAFYSTAIAAIINIVTNLIFITKWGVQAASFSTFMSYFALFLIRYFSANSAFKLRIKMSSFIFWNVGLFLCTFIMIYNQNILITFTVIGIGILQAVIMNRNLIMLCVKSICSKR